MGLLQMKTGLEGYDVKSTDGKVWFRVERKSRSKWNTRVVSDVNQKPVCTIERDEKVR